MSKLKKIDDYIEKHLDESLEDIISKRFASYSKYIIQDRALPDARDGLKPVQRRILYAMNELGMQHNKPYKKSARIAGEVMGKYHPHGDSSIYEAMVRMSQDFKMLVPLIDMHGNNGSIDGDSAAAMRYTEARLSKASESLLEDIDKKTVQFVPNFDDEEVEPVVLPAKFPNLLVNGASGISAGYATKIPPHNLKEVISAVIHYIDHENMTDKDVLKYIKGPDFPTGGIVQGREGIIDAIKTGQGRVILRAKAEIKEVSKSEDKIIISEIPYEVNKSELVRQIDQLRVDKKVEDILEVRDETDQEGLQISIDLKKGSDAQTILNYIFKNTNLQVVYNYNLVSILNNRPILSGFLPVLKAYIDHQKDVITNRSNYELERALKREHIVSGLIKMTSIVDKIVEVIRRSKNKQDSKNNIIELFGFTEIQAEAIVTLQLYRLSTTDIMILNEELESLKIKIEQLNLILSNEFELRKVIKDELREVSNKLGMPRKTLVEEEIEKIEIDEQKLIADELVMVGVTKDGYVKKSSLRSYQATNQLDLKENDSIIYQKELSTLDTLLIFTNLGNYIYIPVHKLDEQRWRDMGLYMGNIVDVEKDEQVVNVINVKSFETDEVLLITSKFGMMKQIKISDLEVSRYSKSIRYMKLQKNDFVVSVDENSKSRIIVLSKEGYGLQFNTSELPVYGLQAGGVKGILLSKDDEARCAIYIKNNDDLLILTSRGHVIYDSQEEIPVYARNRRGIRIITPLKSNPHYIIDGKRVSKEHFKNDAKLSIIGSISSYETKISETKYQYNKYGKKIFDDKHGLPQKMILEKVFEEEEKVLRKKEVKKQEVILEDKVIEEIIKTKSNKEIVISRLDLFDDED